MRFIAMLLLFPGCVTAQAPLLDRGVVSDSYGKTATLDWTAADGSLIGDDFSIGREGETWVIDRVRAWVITSHAFSAALGAQLQRITFWGGLANDQAVVECACHNLRPMKTGRLSEKGSDNPDIVVSPSSVPNLWQVDLQNFRWSVPGGAKVQFAINAVLRNSPQRNSAAKPLLAAVALQDAHSLRIFSQEGAFKSFVNNRLPSSEESLAISIQVWGHPAR
jgi:hypothetical protein